MPDTSPVPRPVAIIGSGCSARCLAPPEFLHDVRPEYQFGLTTEKDLWSGVRARASRSIGAALLLAATLGAPAFSGCASSTPNPNLAKDSVVMNFDLSKCQAIDQNLYRCPAIDKPVCNPEFANADVQCVRVDKNGSVEVLNFAH